MYLFEVSFTLLVKWITKKFSLGQSELGNLREMFGALTTCDVAFFFTRSTMQILLKFLTVTPTQGVTSLRYKKIFQNILVRIFSRNWCHIFVGELFGLLLYSKQTPVQMLKQFILQRLLTEKVIEEHTLNWNFPYCSYTFSFISTHFWSVLPLYIPWKHQQITSN